MNNTTTPRKPHLDAEALLNYAFCLAISQGENFLFDAEFIHRVISERHPNRKLGKRILRKIGTYFQRFSRANLIHNSGQVTRSTRPAHDSKLLIRWRVGPRPSGPLPTKAITPFTSEDAVRQSDSEISNATAHPPRI